MKPKIITLKPFSRKWWSMWHSDVARGKPVGFLSDQARRGIGRTVRASERPYGTAITILVPVAVDGEAFAAWAEHYQRRGIRLPRPDRSPVVWLPTSMPNEAAA
jgi:hypothetical protein